MLSIYCCSSIPDDFVPKVRLYAVTFWSLASLSAPKTRVLIVALNARFYALSIHLSLFFII